MLMGASGCTLMVTGLPLLRKLSLRDRVLPFIAAGPGPRGAGPLTILGRYAGRGGADERLNKRFAEAGSHMTVDRYRAEQMAWAFTAAGSTLALLMVTTVFGTSVRPAAAGMSMIVAGVIGWLGRDWWLGRQAASVRDRIRDELPTAIDLVTLSIMAGETVPVAFTRVAKHLKGETGEALSRTVDEIRNGGPVIEALEGMSERIDDPAVHRFVDALCGAIERGTPLAEVLLAQAEDGREAKRRHLLEMGGRREVLMLVPVVFLIMPVVVLIALYPGLVALDLFVP